MIRLNSKIYDFGGYVCKDILSDGKGTLSIRHSAFAMDDGQMVPLVAKHYPSRPIVCSEEVYTLGYARLEYRNDGIYAYCTLKDPHLKKIIKKLIRRGDIVALSSYATPEAFDGNVFNPNGVNIITYATIMEVGIVLAVDNPGAKIDVIGRKPASGREKIIIYNDSEKLDLYKEILI